MSGWEDFWYVIGNIFTLGGLYMLKIVRKKAHLEAMLAYDKVRWEQAQLQRARQNSVPQPGAHRQIA